jgi:WD40 repeat protein
MQLQRTSSGLFCADINQYIVCLAPHSAVHGGRITSICFDLERELLVSCGRDKAVILFNSLSGSIMSKHRVDAWLSTVQYDEETQNIFVGDFRGGIHVLQVKDGKLSPVNVLAGHSGNLLVFGLSFNSRLHSSSSVGSFHQVLV